MSGSFVYVWIFCLFVLGRKFMANCNLDYEQPKIGPTWLPQLVKYWPIDVKSFLSFASAIRAGVLGVGVLALGAANLYAQPQSARPVNDVDTDPAIATLLKAEPAAAGSDEIRQAWRAVSQWPPERLTEVLEATEEANPVALNWFRTAIDRMMEQPGFKMPVDELQKVVLDRQRNYSTRRIAWELIESSHSPLAESITDSFIDDPISMLRRPAIEKRIAAADQLPKKSAERKLALQEIFRHARDEDQVGLIARVLGEEFGEKPDLAKHFGFILDWHVVGPFANIDEAGFHAVYPPEQITLDDLDAEDAPNESLEYASDNETLRWQPQAAVNDTGELDLNKCLGKEKEVVAYGAAIFHSDSDQTAEIRLRMQNAFKLWLNGKLLESQPIGHTGNSFDQYVIPINLSAGRNLILIKSCQNKPPQEMEWYDVWHLNVRICDASGTALEEGKE
jgi:hypothetical protein